MLTSSSITYDNSDEVAPNRTTLPIPDKSFVVGRYSEDGHKKGERAQPEDKETIDRLKKQLIRSMNNNSGGRLRPGFVMTDAGPVKASKSENTKLKIDPIPVQPKGKPGRKPKIKKVEQSMQIDGANIQPERITAEPEVEVVLKNSVEPEVHSTFPIVFLVESVTIKSMADSVIECDTAIMLVYHSKDHVSCEPAAGGKLKLKIDGREIGVMYLGMMFEWYRTEQQLMVFLKTDI